MSPIPSGKGSSRSTLRIKVSNKRTCDKFLLRLSLTIVTGKELLLKVDWGRATLQFEEADDKR